MGCGLALTAYSTSPGKPSRNCLAAAANFSGCTRYSGSVGFRLSIAFSGRGKARQGVEAAMAVTGAFMAWRFGALGAGAQQKKARQGSGAPFHDCSVAEAAAAAAAPAGPRSIGPRPIGPRSHAGCGDPSCPASSCVRPCGACRPGRIPASAPGSARHRARPGRAFGLEVGQALLQQVFFARQAVHHAGRWPALRRRLRPAQSVCVLLGDVQADLFPAREQRRLIGGQRQCASR